MLSVMLIALAMLAAPLTMRQSMAMAAAPAASQHHQTEAMTASAHCDQQGSSDRDQSGKAAANCCIATCVAVMVPAGATDLPAFHLLAARPGSDARRLSYLGEIATPPPRPA